MQKVLDILEQYVEWVALAIGCLFLLIMVFIYFIGTPVSTKVGDRPVTPANIESFISDGARQSLEQEMAKVGVPSVKVKSYAEGFVEHMENPRATTGPTSPIVWVTAPGTPVTSLRHEDVQTDATKAQNLAGIPQPLPTPTWYGVSTGKTYVQINPAAPIAAIAPPAPPIMRLDANGNPVGPAVPARILPPGGKDEIWTTIAYTISAEDMKAAFDAAKVPGTLSTVFLRLDVVRQEQLEDSSWGHDTAITPLAYHQVPPFPKATAFDEREYTDWASKNAMTLLAPSFYPKLAGETWFAPGQPNPNTISVVRPVVDPIPLPGPRNPRQRVPGVAPTPRARPRAYAPEAAKRPAVPFMQYLPPGQTVDSVIARSMYEDAQARAMQARAANAGGGYGPGGGYGMPPNPYGPAGVGQVQVSVPSGYKVPSGSVNPSELGTEDIFVWFHDDTVEPGKTYRYKMSYRIRNPLFGLDRVAQNIEATKVFAIASPASDWSAPVVIDPISRFFVASGVSSGSNSVRFDVYRWQDGQWQMKQFNASPGDMIGLIDGKIDYQTGWTLADLSATSMSREPVILSDANGKLRSRSYQGDQGSSNQFKKDVAWVDPNAAVRPVTPGMPGMGPNGPSWGPPPGFAP